MDFPRLLDSWNRKGNGDGIVSIDSMLGNETDGQIWLSYQTVALIPHILIIIRWCLRRKMRERMSTRSAKGCAVIQIKHEHDSIVKTSSPLSTLFRRVISYPGMVGSDDGKKCSHLVRSPNHASSAGCYTPLMSSRTTGLRLVGWLYFDRQSMSRPADLTIMWTVNPFNVTNTSAFSMQEPRGRTSPPGSYKLVSTSGELYLFPIYSFASTIY